MKTITKRVNSPSATQLPRHASILGLAGVSILIGGCQFETRPPPFWPSPPEPKVHSIEFHPQYFCSGDRITVTWDTENIDKLELRNSAGDIKLSTDQASGTLTTVPIDASELPLVARGYVGDDFQTHEVTNLVNIDDPAWTTPIPSTLEQVDPDSQRLELADTQIVMLADGSVQEIPVYEIYMTYVSLRWEADDAGTIPSFAPRAKIDRILNMSGPSMNFYSYVAGSTLINAGEAGDIEPDWPGSIARFTGEYPTPKEEFFGWQYGDAKKPPDPWFFIDQVYQEATGLVSLRVYCDVP